MFKRSALALASAGAFFCLAAGASAQTAPVYHVALHVDASSVTQGILRMHETMAVPAGPLTLVYPRWVPGEHAPNGPIPNLADIVVTTGGQPLTWQRDPIDLYAFHLSVPAATNALHVDYTFLGGNAAGYDTARLSTPNILTLEWNKVVLTPQADDQRNVIVTPSIALPSPEWKFATALESTGVRGADVVFSPVTLEMLIDSPLDAGINAHSWPLGMWNGVPVVLAAFADTPDELAATPETIAKFAALVAQDHALYMYRHFNHYTFLLTLSDEMPGEGLEHHQSSDNGEGGDYLIKASSLTAGSDLLPHEFNHSWDGKYRRPYDLFTPNLTTPMVDDLLWVYEGMTQFYGELQAERCGLRTEAQWLDALALNYARLDYEGGRLTDPLFDTARASSIRRGIAPWSSERRGQDYYGEGELVWLEADVLIRKLTGGTKSVDDMARAFFGNGHDTGPEVSTYNRDDIIAALNAVAPYDWRGFLAQRVDMIAPHPPDPFTGGGYRLVYLDKPSDYQSVLLASRKSLDMWYSLGLSARKDGTIVDVRLDSVAGKAGIGPGEKIVAVNGRTLDGQDQIDSALRAAEHGAPVQLLLTGGDVYRIVSLAYTGGPRYPHLERIPGSSDVLGTIAKPLPAVAP